MIMRKEEPLLRKLREVERFLDDHRDGATFISNLLAGLVSRLFGMDQEGPSWLSAVVSHDAHCNTPGTDPNAHLAYLAYMRMVLLTRLLCC